MLVCLDENTFDRSGEAPETSKAKNVHHNKTKIFFLHALYAAIVDDFVSIPEMLAMYSGQKSHDHGRKYLWKMKFRIKIAKTFSKKIIKIFGSKVLKPP